MGIAWQLYTAGTRGYILTGHSMNRKVYRGENPKLFRNNVIANIVMLPLVAAGSAFFVADAVKAIGFLR